MAGRKSKAKSNASNVDNKSNKSRVLAMVMQYENKAAEVAAAAEPPKKTLLQKDNVVEISANYNNSTSGQMKQLATSSLQPSLNTLGNNRRSRRSQGIIYAKGSKTVARDLLRQVKQFYYGQTGTVTSKTWTNKVIDDICKVITGKNSKTIAKSVDSSTIHSDESGDDLPFTGNQLNNSPVAGQAGADDFGSGDASQQKDEKDLKDLKEPEDEEEQYRLFCKQMATILEQASGFPLTDIGLSLADFRILLQQYGLTSAQQLFDESSKMRLLYEPQVIVLGNHTQISRHIDDPALSQPDSASLPSKAKSVHVSNEEVYFYPNKLVFQ